MTDLQSYPAIGIPTFDVMVGIVMNVIHHSAVNARFNSLDARFKSVDARLDGLNEQTASPALKPSSESAKSTRRANNGSMVRLDSVLNSWKTIREDTAQAVEDFAAQPLARERRARLSARLARANA